MPLNLTNETYEGDSIVSKQKDKNRLNNKITMDSHEANKLALTDQQSLERLELNRLNAN